MERLGFLFPENASIVRSTCPSPRLPVPDHTTAHSTLVDQSNATFACSGSGQDCGKYPPKKSPYPKKHHHSHYSLLTAMTDDARGFCGEIAVVFVAFRDLGWIMFEALNIDCFTILASFSIDDDAFNARCSA
jgi:hypothetical protein